MKNLPVTTALLSMLLISLCIIDSGSIDVYSRIILITIGLGILFKSIKLIKE